MGSHWRAWERGEMRFVGKTLRRVGEVWGRKWGHSSVAAIQVRHSCVCRSATGSFRYVNSHVGIKILCLKMECLALPFISVSSQTFSSIQHKDTIKIYWFSFFFFWFVDTIRFVDDCTKHHSIKQLQLSPRLLEVTNTIRVENLPPGADDYSLKLFFENPYNGGGRVANVEYFPEESSALIEFFDRKGNIY